MDLPLADPHDIGEFRSRKYAPDALDNVRVREIEGLRGGQGDLLKDMVDDTANDMYSSMVHGTVKDHLMPELLVRAGITDQQVIADLLAPRGGAATLSGHRGSIDRLVVDAHVAAQRPAYAGLATHAGIPFLVDPITPLLQGQLRPEDAWAKLPFGRSEEVRPADLQAAGARRALVEAVVDFQVTAGATGVIPPYPYVASPEDPWFRIALDLLTDTAAYMARAGIRLPVVPVLCAQLHGFGNPKAFEGGLDHFAEIAGSLDPQYIALCLSPAGSANDGYAKVFRLFQAAARVRETNVPVLAWRQGVYGLALVAAGLDGYETGLGTREQTNIRGSILSRKPQPQRKKGGGGAAPGVFLEPLGRSVPAKVAHALLGQLSMRAKVMCDDETCCPHGPASTLDHRREHAARARARALAALEEMPQSAWRLHRISRDAQASVTLITQANAVLRQEKIKDRLHTESSASLASVADHLRALGQATGGHDTT